MDSSDWMHLLNLLLYTDLLTYVSSALAVLMEFFV